MDIERSAPYEPLPEEENDTIEALFTPFYFEGQGFDKLSQTLFVRHDAVTNYLRDRKPLFLITDYAGREVAARDAINMRVAEGLGIPRESELVTYLELKDFSDGIAQEILEYGARTLIQPLKVGPGESPKWWIGPLWKLYTPGNLEAFRRQFAEVEL